MTVRVAGSGVTLQPQVNERREWPAPELGGKPRWTSRLLALVFPVAIATLGACTAPLEEDTAAAGTSELNKSPGCSLGRSEILRSASGSTQRRAIERGFAWLDARVPYNQGASHGGYRTDCSGFVSMCWELGRSATTSELVSNSDDWSRLGSYDDLAPADALVRQGHVMLFLGWDDRARSRACVLEQASTKSDMQFRTHASAKLRSAGYQPVRASTLGGGTSVDEAPVAAPPRGGASAGPPGPGGGTNACSSLPRCDRPRWIGDIEADLPGDSLVHRGTGDSVLSFTAFEVTGELGGSPMQLLLRLGGTGAYAYEIESFYDSGCNEVAGTNGVPGEHVVSWGEGGFANGFDDTREIVVRVRQIASCGSSMPWTLTVESF